MSTTSADTTVNLSLIGAIVGVATIGGFMFGYDSGAINGTQEGLKTTFHLSEFSLGLTVAALLPGGAVGAFTAGRLADSIGRKKVMMVAAVLFILSAWASGAAPSALVLALARICAGAAVGAASVLSPAYISEVTPANIRGRLSSIQQIMIIGGLTGAFLANYYLAGAAGASTNKFWLDFAAWRWMFWVQILPAALFLITLIFIPESPRFLVAQGREAEAEGIIARLFGTGTAKNKVADIRASLAIDHKPKLADVLQPATGKLRKIVWIGIGLAVVQQLVGINVVFYYGAVLWQAVGFSEADSLKINILSGTLSILSCFIAISLIDKIGRKPLLLVGSIGMAATLAALTYCFASGAMANGKLILPGSNGIIALCSANFYVIFFNLSWGPVMWVMLGEMFPNQMRGVCARYCWCSAMDSKFYCKLQLPMVGEKHWPCNHLWWLYDVCLYFDFVRPALRL